MERKSNGKTGGSGAVEAGEHKIDWLGAGAKID
jgi:hypothetical protein